MTHAPGAGPSNGELIGALYAAVAATREATGVVLTELDLTEALADVLWQLQPGEAVARRELAARLRCDPSNVTFLVDRLDSRGLVRRGPHPGDRRVKAVELTDVGRSARERLVRATQESAGLRGLSGEEKTQLHQLLLKCAEGVTVA